MIAGLDALSDRTRVVISRVVVGIGFACGIAALVAYGVAGDFGALLGGFGDDQLAGVVITGVIVWIALPRSPANGALWVLAWVGLLLGIEVAGGAIGFAISGIEASDLGPVIPNELDRAAAIAFFFPQSMWFSLFVFLIFGMLLFPDGRLPSPRWTWFARTVGAAVAVLAAASAWAARPWSDLPYDVTLEDEFHPVAIIGGIPSMLLQLSVFVALFSLVQRWRRSSGIQRQQFRWIVWAFAFFVGGSVIGFMTNSDNVTGPLASAAIAIAYGVAITKYRLYEIDVIISKTVLFGLLAAFIAGVYALIVVGVGSWVGAGTSNIGLSIAATALVAVAFEPVRARVQRFANRVVYGARATPYQVLSDLTARLATAESTDGLLERMAQRLAEGTGASQVAIRLRGDAVPVAIWSDGSKEAMSDGHEVTVPILRGEEELGSISVEKGRGEQWSPTELGLVEDLAGSAGMVLSRVRLDADLEARAEELRSSRRRMVDAQAEERRHLERDLHDGAQQQIVALKVKLGLAERFAKEEGSEGTAGLITQMANDAQMAIEEIRSLAKGIFPPLLEAEGLRSALVAGAANAPIPVIVGGDGLGRYSIDVEAAAYFCITEAITNAVKHAQAQRIEVRLIDEKAGLAFAVRDDGVGFDAAEVSGGSGIVGMRDRLEAVGGTMSVESSPGAGATIAGFIPASSHS